MSVSLQETPSLPPPPEYLKMHVSDRNRPMLYIQTPRKPRKRPGIGRYAVYAVCAFSFGVATKAVYLSYEGDPAMGRLIDWVDDQPLLSVISRGHSEERHEATGTVPPIEPNDTVQPATPEPIAVAPPQEALRVMDAATVSVVRSSGDRALQHRDIGTARLFYQRAAEGGDAQAALALGMTFDETFLRSMGAPSFSDPAQAERWFSRARDLGDPQAAGLLKPPRP